MSAFMTSSPHTYSSPWPSSPPKDTQVNVGTTQTASERKRRSRASKPRKVDPEKATGPTNQQKFDEMLKRMNDMQIEINTLRAIILLANPQPYAPVGTVPHEALGGMYNEMTQRFMRCMKPPA